jgi:hypothetical protein
MANKDHCAVCDNAFHGKQNVIQCAECGSRIHNNCLQTGESEDNVSASSVKCAYKCKKLMGDTTKERALAMNCQIEALSLKTEFSPRIGDDPQSAQLEAARVNGLFHGDGKISR